MSIAQGRDLLKTTIAVASGAAPTITSGSEFTTGNVALADLPARPTSVVFDLPIEFLIPQGEDVNYVGHLQKSANGSDWEDIAGSECSGEWSNSDVDDLTVKTSIRIGGDLVQSNLAYVRAQGTVTRSDAGVTMTQRGLCITFGGLDETASLPRTERQVV